MKVYIVKSRDVGSFVFCTTDMEKAKYAKRQQIYTEEMGGGRPSVYILETTLIK